MTKLYFLILTISLSVLLFGTVEGWSLALIGIITVIYFNVWLYKDRSRFGFRGNWQRVFIFSVSGFILYGLLQVIPLPVSLVKYLTPSTYNLFNSFNTGSGSTMTISLYPHETLNQLSRYIIYIMVFMISASFTGDKQLIKRVIAGLIVFGFMLSLFAILQKAAWNGKIYWFRELTAGGEPFGPFVNRNHFAGFVGMIIPLGLGYVLESRRMDKKLFYIFSSVIMTLAMIYSLSRGGIMSFLISTGVFTMVIVRRGMDRKGVFYLLLVFMILIFYMFYLGFMPLIERFEKSGLTSGGRLLVWEGTLRAFGDFMWLGTGYGTFRYVFSLYSPDGLLNEFRYAHNDYLQTLLEAGIIGSLFVITFFVTVLIKTLKYLAVRWRRTSYIFIGMVTSVIYMAIHSIFDFNLHIPSNAITFSAIVGLIVSYTGGTNNVRRRPDEPEAL